MPPARTERAGSDCRALRFCRGSCGLPSRSAWADNMERVLADIDSDSLGRLRHGVLLVVGAPCQLKTLAGQEHGRTIPLADLRDERYTCPPPGPHHQCAFSTASTDVTPAIIEPVIATSAGTPRGNSRLISEAMKIAAMGRAMTK